MKFGNGKVISPHTSTDTTAMVDWSKKKHVNKRHPGHKYSWINITQRYNSWYHHGKLKMPSDPSKSPRCVGANLVTYTNFDLSSMNKCMVYWYCIWISHDINLMPNASLLTHWGRDKWAPFSRRHFQMYFLEWKCMDFDWDFTEVCSHGSN